MSVVSAFRSDDDRRALIIRAIVPSNEHDISEGLKIGLLGKPRCSETISRLKKRTRLRLFSPLKRVNAILPAGHESFDTV
jgi:hypothetical protein